MKDYMFENWKPINGYETRYEISDWGRVRNKDNKLLKWSFNRDGYPRVKLYNDNRCKMAFVHRLVSQHFNENPNGYKEVNLRPNVNASTIFQRSNGAIDNITLNIHKRTSRHQ